MAKQARKMAPGGKTPTGTAPKAAKAPAKAPARAAPAAKGRK